MAGFTKVLEVIVFIDPALAAVIPCLGKIDFPELYTVQMGQERLKVVQNKIVFWEQALLPFTYSSCCTDKPVSECYQQLCPC